MRTYDFSRFDSLIGLLDYFNTEKKCIKFLEKELWEDGTPISPYDPTSKVYGRGDGLYRSRTQAGTST